MDEAQEILLRSLENGGVTLPTGISSIQDLLLSPDALFSICSQSLRLLLLIDSSSSSSLPISTTDRFKICTDIASAIKTLGFSGDLSFHQFLYPSIDDSLKLVRFLVERLSQTSEDRQLIGKETREKILENEAVRDEWKERADNQSVDHSHQVVPFRISSLRIRNEENQSGENVAPLITQQAKPKLQVDPSVLESNDVQRLKAGLPGSSAFVTEEILENGLRQVLLVPGQTDGLDDAEVSASGSPKSRQKVGARREEDINELSEESDKSIRDTFASVAQTNGRYITELEQKLASLQEQSAKITLEIEDLKQQDKMLTGELTEKTLEVKHLEDEHMLLNEAVEMAFDDKHPSEYYFEELNNQVQVRRNNLVELESQWEAFKRPLEEKKISLERSLHEQKSEGQDKLVQLEKVELEIQAIVSEILKREEEHSKLSADLENQPKIASRKSYIQRITEITKNSRKQDADIERILQETRLLQIESNSIQDRLHRTYTVVDETIFRDAKLDPTRRHAYRLLTSLHDSFEQISDRILATDRVRREATELEANLAAMVSRSFDIDKLEADLNAIRKENDLLEQQLQHSKCINPLYHDEQI